MSTLCVAYINPKDAEIFENYQEVAGQALAKHGGKVLSKTPKPTRLEGTLPAPAAMVLLEFPDAAAAHEWHNDPELAEVHALRIGGADVSIFVLDPAL